MAKQKLTATQQTVQGFEELYNVLFSGDVPDRESLFNKIEAGEKISVREAFIARAYANGVKVAGAVRKDSRLGPLAKQVLDNFGEPKAGQQPVASGLASQIKSVASKAGGLDTSFEDLVNKSKFKQITGIEGITNALVSGVEEFKKGALSTKGKGGKGKLTFDNPPTDKTMAAIIEGIARIPNEELRDAVYLSTFGVRGEALVDTSISKEVSLDLEVERPYYVPETQTLMMPEVDGRKKLGDDRKMGPIATSILERRFNQAVSNGQDFLFPTVSQSDITNALKKYVFNPEFFPAEELRVLGRMPVGTTDLRRLFVDYVRVNYPDELETAESLLGHKQGPKGSTAVGRKFYMSGTSELKDAIGTFLTEFEQRMGKLVEADTFNAYSASLNVPFDDSRVVNFVDLEEQKKEVQAGLREEIEAEKTPMSAKERKALENKRIETANRAAEESRLAGEQAGLAAAKVKQQRLQEEQKTAQIQDTAPTKKERLQQSAIQDAEEIAKKTGGLNLGGIFDFGKKALGALGVPGMGYIDTENRLRVLEQAGYAGPQAEQYVTQDIGMKEGPLGVVELVGQGMRAGMEQLGIKEPLSQEEIDAQQVQAYENQLLNMGINPEDIKAR